MQKNSNKAQSGNQVRRWHMVDLCNDPRSSSAILRGHGDGRDKLCEKFVEYWHRKRPELTEDDLFFRFERYAFMLMIITHRCMGNRGVMNDRVCITLMRLLMFMGWYGPKHDPQAFTVAWIQRVRRSESRTVRLSELFSPWLGSAGAEASNRKTDQVDLVRSARSSSPIRR